MTDSRRRISLRAYAKINLSLDVGPLRTDGYHEIASVMQSISLFDTVVLTRTNRAGISIRCESAAGHSAPSDPTNLAYRAASSILEAGNIATGVSIRLIKRIPSEAGLGGGSSDAAATLAGVDRLYDLNLGDQRLSKLAGELGSDVPFFLTGGSAVSAGRGERIEPLIDLPDLHLVVVKPRDAVSTGWAYRQLDEMPSRVAGNATAAVLKALSSRNADAVISALSNDFERPILAVRPKIERARRRVLEMGALAARLCGSGAAIYGVFPTARAAGIAAAAIRPECCAAWVATTLGRAEAAPWSGASQ